MTGRVELAVGQQVKFSYPRSERRAWWTVRAVSADGRWAVLTRQAPFQPKGKVVYTIIDWERGVRGPCDLLGQGWDFKTDLVVDGQRLIRALEARRETEAWFKGKPLGTSRPVTEPEVEVSYRNNVEIQIAKVK